MCDLKRRFYLYKLPMFRLLSTEKVNTEKFAYDGESDFVLHSRTRQKTETVTKLK